MSGDIIAVPDESGWYLARKRIWSPDDNPVVVRVTVDPQLATTVWQIASRDPSTLDEWSLLEKIRRDGRCRDLELDRLQKEAHADGVKQGREEAHRQQVDYEAQRDRECPTFPAWTDDPDFREMGEPIIALQMRVEHAEALQNMLSDLLCWGRGFKAALGPDEYDRAPMGLDAVRTIRETITKAQCAADRHVEEKGSRKQKTKAETRKEIA